MNEDLTKKINAECKELQVAVSKYGHQLVCDEDTTEEAAYPFCEDMKEVVSKYGHTLVCPDEK